MELDYDVIPDGKQPEGDPTQEIDWDDEDDDYDDSKLIITHLY